MDAIAALAFGLDINSQEDPDSPFVNNASRALTSNVTSARVILTSKQMVCECWGCVKGVSLSRSKNMHILLVIICIDEPD